MNEAERIGLMGRAEERRARQRGGRRAAPPMRSSAPAAPAGGTDTMEPTVIGGRAAARKAAKGRGRPKGKGKGKDGRSFIRRLFTWKKIVGTIFALCLLGMGAFVALYVMT